MQRNSGRVASRRTIVFGPGIVIALVAAWFIWRTRPAAPAGPPHVVSRPPVSTPAGFASAPDPDWLVKQRATLRLNRRQSQRLRALAMRWDCDTAALRRDLETESNKSAQAFMEARRRGASLEEMRAIAQPVSDLTRALITARVAWWTQAGAVLTVDQRRRALDSWQHRFAGGR